MFWHIKSKNPTVSVAKLYAIFKTYKTLNKPILYFLRPDLYGSLCAVLRVWFGMFPVFFVLIFICFIAESLQYGKQSIKKFTKVPVSTTVICLSWWSCSVSEVKGWFVFWFQMLSRSQKMLGGIYNWGRGQPLLSQTFEILWIKSNRLHVWSGWYQCDLKWQKEQRRMLMMKTL